MRPRWSWEIRGGPGAAYEVPFIHRVCIFSSGNVLKPETAAILKLLLLVLRGTLRSRANWKLVGKCTRQRVPAFLLAGLGFFSGSRVYILGKSSAH